VRNLWFYDPTRVTSVTGVDPSEALLIKTRTAPHGAGLAVEILGGEAENLPFADLSFDTIVCTFTRCSVRSPLDKFGPLRMSLDLGASTIELSS